MAISPSSPAPYKPVCRFWSKGYCKYGSNCRFLHPDKQSPVAAKKLVPPPASTSVFKKTAPTSADIKKKVATITAAIKNETPTKAETTKTVAIKKVAPIKEESPSKAETTGTTAIESFSGPFGSLANLQGHKKDVTGIVLPTGSDKLFTSSSDGTMCIWNCNTGECVASGNLGGEIGCLISEGTWVFAGLKNLIKAWNVANNSGGEPICLNHCLGQVYSMEADEDLLYAGTQEGSILGHSGYVTSLLCWDVVLFTSSLDKIVNAWAYEDGELKVVHSHQEEDGVVKLSGLQKDAETDPTLFCCLKDNSVRLYDIPSFAEKGRICSNKEVKAMKTGPGDMFFTGDGTGKVAVWNLYEEPSKAVAAS
ncbi:hypothetical protein SLEP1_g19746 [Rubroshorea leprosula]|uniref:C3H1-type domain-containing protein n=1 Tax=Rubroshorea leprosula TaxID=152421 RepID=A0AAV5J7Z5_9ROSI|nr:hypothetical protein SLEP1_g19746 [Rubroshorea leprosula]